MYGNEAKCLIKQKQVKKLKKAPIKDKKTNKMAETTRNNPGTSM